MVNDKLFYSNYLKEYHAVKAIYLKTLLNNHEELNKELKKYEFGQDLITNTKFIIQADMRQTYFHAIETFFELFFAFIPQNGKVPDHFKIIKRLSKANWRNNYKMISQISDGTISLDFLDQSIQFLDHNVTTGHYLFYPGIFDTKKFLNEVFESIDNSIIALKYAIKAIASDFIARDEYNAYKHGIRIFPTYKSIHILDAETAKQIVTWDLSNSISYYTYDDTKQRAAISTNLFDTERDFQMICLCGNLVNSMIYYRDIMINPENRSVKEKVPIRFFNLKAVEDCTQHHVEVQNIVFSNYDKN